MFEYRAGIRSAYSRFLQFLERGFAYTGQVAELLHPLRYGDERSEGNAQRGSEERVSRDHHRVRPVGAVVRAPLFPLVVDQDLGFGGDLELRQISLEGGFDRLGERLEPLPFLDLDLVAG